MSLPTSDFTFPPLIKPLSGLNNDEMDFEGESVRNVEFSNEHRSKTADTLNYFSGFTETKITDMDGFVYTVLARSNGADSPSTTSLTLPYTIYYADGSTSTITEAEIFADYDPTPEDEGGEGHTEWGVQFEISAGEMTGYVEFNDHGDRFIEEAVPSGGSGGSGSSTEQTGYWLPVILGGERVSTGGLYEEYIRCKDGSPQTLLTKVG